MSTIKLRRDTAANWLAANPILSLAEPGLETDTNKIKYGDGVHHWSELSYAGGASGTIWTNNANGCLRVELSSTGFQAFTDGTHIDLQDGGQWNVGSYQNNTSIGNDGFANPRDLWLRSGSATFITSDLDYGDGNQWMFSGSNIQLPNNGDIVRWNGSAMVSVLGANTGNYTFSGDTITNNNGFTLDAGSRGTITLGTFIEVPGVDEHFHIAFPNSNIVTPYQDLYLGNDRDYVKIRGSHNEQILGVDIGAGGRRWEFNPDGTTIFPDNIINAGNNSIAIEAGDGISTIYANDDGSIALQGQNPNFDPTDNNNQLYEAVISVGEAFGFNELLGTDYTGPTLGVGSVTDANGTNPSEMLGLWTVDTDGNLITVKAKLSGDYGYNVEISTGDIRDYEGNSLIYVPASDTAPTHKMDGLLWYNSDEGRMYIKYMGAWVDASPTVIPPPVEITQLTNGENTVTLDTSGFLEFSSGGAVGNVQQTLSPSGNTNLPGIDLYATPDMAWAQLNYANTNYVWVDSSAAYFDVEEARLKLKSDGVLELNKLFGATIRLGEVGDNDAVLWVDPSPGTEYLGLWWAGNTNYNQSGGPNGYGPDAGINIGTGDWDDQQNSVDPDTNVTVGVGQNSWRFGADGSIKFPYQPTNERTGSGDAFVFAKNPEPQQKIIATQSGNNIFPEVERLVIAGGDGYGTGEGGDIYLWAGKGHDGGDIKVDAGYGTGAGQYGGTIKIRAGNNTATGAHGGFVHIEGGKGSASGYHGEVKITTADNTHQWIFDGDGTLTTPGNIFSGSKNIGVVTPAPLNLNNTGPVGQSKTQLNLINTAGNSGTGSAIDYYTYVDQGNGLPGARLSAVDDNNYSANFSVRLKSRGDAGNGSLDSTVWLFGSDGNLTLPQGSIIGETSTTTVITPPGALAGQSLVIRPTAGQFNVATDHPSGFVPGETITITVSNQFGVGTGSLDYEFTGATAQQLGHATTGTLTFTSESAKTVTWTVPAESRMTTFTFSLVNGSGFVTQGGINIGGLPNITVTLNGTVIEGGHVHLIAGDPTTTDIFLGDDNHYVKIEKNYRNVAISAQPFSAGPYTIVDGNTGERYLGATDIDLSLLFASGDILIDATTPSRTTTVTEIIGSPSNGWTIRATGGEAWFTGVTGGTLSFARPGNGGVWTFDTNGDLTFPANGRINNAVIDGGAASTWLMPV